MAGVAQQGAAYIDGKCRYTDFRSRPEGKVPCLGLGGTTSADLENTIYTTPTGVITGITFQKVDTGNVKAALRVDSFVKVNWEDAPTRPPAPEADDDEAFVRHLNNRLDIGQVQANDVRPQWQEFTDAMALVKDAVLNRMTPSAPLEGALRRPKYLLDGFNKEIWNGAPGQCIRYIVADDMLEQIKSDIRGGANWDPNTDSWASSLCSGLTNAEGNLKDLFEYLLPNCKKPPNQKLVTAKSNGGIEQGAVRCLMYGYQTEQVRQNRRGAQRNRDLEHRFLLTKRSGANSRSRSRSPASSDDDSELYDNVSDQQNPARNVHLNDLLGNPERYHVRPGKLHVYFESDKPDLVILKRVPVPDTDNPGYRKSEFTVKVAIEIASHRKTKGASVSGHIQNSVEQCVQSCLAAFACNQDLMYGLVVVVDGFVLIKVQKEQNQDGQEEYSISETDLIMWDNADSLHALFSTLDTILDL